MNTEQDDVTTEQAARELGLDDGHPARSWSALAEEPTVVEATGSTVRELTPEEAAESLARWEEAKRRYQEKQHALEIEAAGDPANIGTDGLPHFEHMTQTAENPPAFSSLCGTCGTLWPCAQQRAMQPADQVQEADAGRRYEP